MSTNFPTPTYKIEENEQSVYPPSEDTFLLMDALEKEREVRITIFFIANFFSY